MVKKGYASGVWAIRRAQFEDINGFSNELWDWDMEDDDLNNRLKGKGYDMVCDLSRGGYFYNLDQSQVVGNLTR